MREDGQPKGTRKGLPERNVEDGEMKSRLARRGLWKITKDRLLEDRGGLPREDGNRLREYRSMHEENFLSSWLREDVEGRWREKERGSKSEECVF